MNKLKLILTACIAAVLTLSCSTESDDDDKSSSSAGGTEISSSSSNPGTGGSKSSSSSDPGPSTSVEWDATGSVELGGLSANIGSSLDVDTDPFKVYTISQLGTNKNKIDLVFDGTNLWTPHGIGTASPAVGSLTSAFAGIDNDVWFFEIPSHAENNAYDLVYYMPYFDDEYVEKMPVSANMKFGAITSDENLALVVVNNNTAQILKIDVSRISEDSYCNAYPDDCEDDYDYCDEYPEDCGEGGGDDYCDLFLDVCNEGIEYYCEAYERDCYYAAAKPLPKIKAKAASKAKPTAKAKVKAKIKTLLKKKK